MTKENRLPDYRLALIDEVGAERIYYCPEHKEYFSNNCSECMLLANDPDTIAKTRSETLKEVGNYLENNFVRMSEFVFKLKNGSMPE